MSPSKFIVAAALALLSLASQAQTIGLHCCSIHDPDPHHLANNGNLGMYVRFDNGFTMGGYVNSFKRETYYVGWTTNEWYRLSATALVASGYIPDGTDVDKEPNVLLKAFGHVGLIPVILPTLRLVSFDANNLQFVASADRVGIYSLRLGFLPKIDGKGADVWTLMAEGKF